MNRLTVCFFAYYLVPLSVAMGQITPVSGTGNTTVKQKVVLPTAIDKSITAEQTIISVTTNKISNIVTNSAWCSYTVKSESQIMQHGVCVSKASAPTIDNVKYFSKGVTGPTYSAEMTDLFPNMKYYVRAFAKNSSGTIFYGNELTFNTLPQK